jgi:formylglycine-generating enzyme required for sulfatase activity
MRLGSLWGLGLVWGCAGFDAPPEPVGWSAEPPTWPLASEAVGPPPNLVMQPGVLLIGQARQVRVGGAPPSVNGGLLATTRASGAPSCPPPLAPQCLDLPAPTLLLGTVRSNTAGNFVWNVTVPSTVPDGTLVRLQAAVPSPTGGAYLSNVEAMEVLDPALDHDDDGLSTGQEITYLTDYYDADTDGDGFTDGEEVAGGFDPRDRNDFPECTSDPHCDDGLFCTGIEGCVLGHCQVVSGPVVDDGDVCTVDDCDTTTDAPRHLPEDCDDADPDTYDTCRPASGCVHLPACEVGDAALTDFPLNAAMRCVPPGTFTAGCVPGRDNVPAACYSEEGPAHTVELTRAIWMMRNELTQGQYLALMGANPSFNPGCGSTCPVENLMFWDALRVANAASAAAGLPACYTLGACSGTPGTSFYTCASLTVNTPSGSPYDCTGYRLPTEAEWEHAARGGEGYAFAGSNTLTTVGWSDPQGAPWPIHPVCGKALNGYGFCDLTGNVFEWTWDGASFYTSAAVTDPIGMGFADFRVYRGGGKHSDAQRSRVSYRPWQARYYRANDLGVRLVRTASADTDGDGLQDRDEVGTHGSDPLDTDTDDDGLNDAMEVNTLGTDPTLADTDGDGVDDNTEVANGTDPLTAQDVCLRAMDNTTSAGLGGAMLRCAPAGTYTRGCVAGRDDADGPCLPGEQPAHEVELTRGFWVMESEVTQSQWQAVMGSNPSSRTGCSNCPVEQVSWWDALAFANTLSVADGLAPCYQLAGCSGVPGGGYTCASATVTASSVYTCEGYRLPTEAEWEYAARGGEEHAYAGSNSADAVAWYGSNTLETRPVCLKADNGFGLCDLSGNVEEWAWDDFSVYPSSAAVDPVSAPGEGAITRGGHYVLLTSFLRNASRNPLPTGQADGWRGFRVVRTAD